jgi:2-polyprenyl-3-methyl-5-hydroxy-6-metoxy-1,4-benzoquinol methylase
VTSRVARAYWNERALLFGGRGDGLGAVASYGMPGFYNRSIDLVQWLSLRPWLAEAAGRTILDVGCGIGRWSRRFARCGARVVGVDPSTAMVREARRRTSSSGLDDRCAFLVGDLTELRLRARFDRILAVTVLQHIMEEGDLVRALVNLKALLNPEGRLVLLEVAPGTPNGRCDGSWFQSRSLAQYRDSFRASGLRLLETRGVDPAPLKIWVLPWYRSLPSPLAKLVLWVATALATPFDAVWGRSLPGWSWHKVMVLTHDD